MVFYIFQHRFLCPQLLSLTNRKMKNHRKPSGSCFVGHPVWHICILYIINDRKCMIYIICYISYMKITAKLRWLQKDIKNNDNLKIWTMSITNTSFKREAHNVKGCMIYYLKNGWWFLTLIEKAKETQNYNHISTTSAGDDLL